MAAGSAKIGALMVSLGIDSASFETGLKKAQVGLDRFGKAAGAAFAALGAATAVAGVALGVAVKNAIDNADAMSKSAQKAGVTTEALSRLAYAASYSDVSVEQLTGGLQKLSKAMTDSIVNKTSTAAVAFKALGISVTDSNGKLKSSDAVFAEIADKFSRMEDGATKTSLAMMVFGKSGADMIPLLNGGSAELKRMADEADRLGITLSTKAGREAERFNDTMALVGKVIDGVVIKVMEAALPALQSLAQLLASPEFATAAQVLADNVISGLTQIIEFVVKVINYFDELERRAQMEKAKRGLALTLGGKRPAGNSKNTVHTVDSLYDGMLGPDGRIVKLPEPEKPAGKSEEPFEPVITGIAKARKEIQMTLPAITQMQQGFLDVGRTVDDAISGALSGMVKGIIKGEDAFGGLIDKVGQLGDKLIDMAFDQAIQGLFGMLLGGAMGGMGGFKGSTGMGGFAGSVKMFPGFANGGSGMIGGAGPSDSKFFGAWVTPGEPFAFGDDALRGTGSGGDDRPVMQFNITGSREDATEIARIAREQAMSVLLGYQKNSLRR